MESPTKKEKIEMSKVIVEFTGVICLQCLLFNANDETDPELSEVDTVAFVARVSEFMAKYTFSACDQWAEGYDEFSVRPCSCCKDSSGGPRYETTFTQFVKEFCPPCE